MAFRIPFLNRDVPEDQDPNATYTEIPERGRIRQVLQVAQELMELPPPVVMICERLLAKLSDAQCRDVCHRMYSIAIYLHTGKVPEGETLPAEDAEIANAISAAPGGRKALLSSFGG